MIELFQRMNRSTFQRRSSATNPTGRLMARAHAIRGDIRRRLLSSIGALDLTMVRGSPEVIRSMTVDIQKPTCGWVVTGY